jgi:hypothetical protein
MKKTIFRLILCAGLLAALGLLTACGNKGTSNSLLPGSGSKPPVDTGSSAPRLTITATINGTTAESKGAVKPLVTVDYGKQPYEDGEDFRWDIDDMINLAFSENFQNESNARYLVRFRVASVSADGNTATFEQVGVLPEGFKFDSIYQVYAAYPSDMMIKSSDLAPVSKGIVKTGTVTDSSSNPPVSTVVDYANYLIGESSPGHAYFPHAIMPTTVYQPEKAVNLKDVEHKIEPLYMHAYANAVTVAANGDVNVSLGFQHLTSLLRWTVKNATAEELVIKSLSMQLNGGSFIGAVNATPDDFSNLNLDAMSSTSNIIIDTDKGDGFSGTAKYLSIPAYETVDFYRPFFPAGYMTETTGMILEANIAAGAAGGNLVGKVIPQVGVTEFEPGMRYYFNIKIGSNDWGYALNKADYVPTAGLLLCKNDDGGQCAGADNILSVLEGSSISLSARDFNDIEQVEWTLPGRGTFIANRTNYADMSPVINGLSVGEHPVSLRVQSIYKDDAGAWFGPFTGKIIVEPLPPSVSVEPSYFIPTGSNSMTITATAAPGRTDLKVIVFSNRYPGYGSRPQLAFLDMVEKSTGSGIYTAIWNAVNTNTTDNAILPKNSYDTILYSYSAGRLDELASTQARIGGVDRICIQGTCSRSGDTSSVDWTTSLGSSYQLIEVIADSGMILGVDIVDSDNVHWGRLLQTWNQTPTLYQGDWTPPHRGTFKVKITTYSGTPYSRSESLIDLGGGYNGSGVITEWGTIQVN